MQTESVRLLRLPEVTHLCGRSRAAIYQDVKAGKFPAPLRIGKRAIAWNSEAVAAWVASRTAVGAQP